MRLRSNRRARIGRRGVLRITAVAAVALVGASLAAPGPAAAVGKPNGSAAAAYFDCRTSTPGRGRATSRRTRVGGRRPRRARRVPRRAGRPAGRRADGNTADGGPARRIPDRAELRAGRVGRARIRAGASGRVRPDDGRPRHAAPLQGLRGHAGHPPPHVAAAGERRAGVRQRPPRRRHQARRARQRDGVADPRADGGVDDAEPRSGRRVSARSGTPAPPRPRPARSRACPAAPAWRPSTPGGTARRSCCSTRDAPRRSPGRSTRSRPPPPTTCRSSTRTTAACCGGPTW